MLRDAGEGKFGFVLFWCLAQFSMARTAGTLEYLRRLDCNGVGWRSYTEPCLDSDGSCREAVLAVFSILGAHEGTVISERTVAGLERAREAGRTGGRPRLSLDAAEVARLRSEGLTLKAIAARLGTSKSSVHRIIKGE
jgi:DNA invertase Pin-like site-specific DNA recombinase